jgi:hypothetical protein
MDAYWKNRSAANSVALDALPLASAVISFVESRGRWAGTATVLLQELNKLTEDDTKRQRIWPKASNALSNKLRRLMPNLRDAGIAVTLDDRVGKAGSRIIRLEILQKRSSESSARTEVDQAEQF